MILEARGGVEPRAFRPALEVRFRRPMPGTRAAIGGDGEIRTHTMLFTRQPPCHLDHIASIDQEQEAVVRCTKFRAPVTCSCVLSWCPRKDLNLQPLVCRTSAPSVELLGQRCHGLAPWSFTLAARQATNNTGWIPRDKPVASLVIGGRSWNRTNLSGFSDPR